MAEEHHSPSDHQNISNNETKSTNHNKKNDSLYVEPLPKCYIGIGNNPEL